MILPRLGGVQQVFSERFYFLGRDSGGTIPLIR
jgi:hypothetical protein